MQAHKKTIDNWLIDLHSCNKLSYDNRHAHGFHVAVSVLLLLLLLLLLLSNHLCCQHSATVCMCMCSAHDAANTPADLATRLRPVHTHICH
jgi:hypothetical protein